MSLAKEPKPRKNKDKKDKIFGHEPQNVGSKHNDSRCYAGQQSNRRSSGSKDKTSNSTLKTKKKEFVIPRKKKQAKELLQSHRFDSRETKELLRSVQLSLRDPNFWPLFKFERVEFVNNESLSRKYGEKKQALRLDAMRTNRELEDKFAFLYTTSRTEAKSICEHGLRTGHCLLTSLGDPKLGVYLCRFADVINKRPLTSDDAGYLLVFRVVKGKVRFIGGSNPEQQPTPHHDCHVSKLLTTLSSKASHSDVFESSQFYFYEIDENSDDFHVRQPRQVLPYAVLTFSIVKTQQTKLENKPEGKKASVNSSDVPSSAEEITLSSPNRIEDKGDTISNTHVSWSGVLGINKKSLAYINFLSYSRKKHPLPAQIDHINVSQKISQDDLRSIFKCPVFRNGKPSSSGVCIELDSSKKVIYYEVKPVNQVQDKFDELVSHLSNTKMAGVIEYFSGAVHMYLIPTSKLTHDIGITDRKSPLVLHVLVDIKQMRHLTTTQESNDEEKATDINDTSLNEAVVRSQVQEIFKQKYEEKSSHRKTRRTKLPSLISFTQMSSEVEKDIDLTTGQSERKTDGLEARLPLPPEKGSPEKRLKYQKDAQKWVEKIFKSETIEKDSSIEKQDLQPRGDTPTRNSRLKLTNSKLLNDDCPLMSQVNINEDLKKTSGKKEQMLSSTFTNYTNQNIYNKQDLRLALDQDKNTISDQYSKISLDDTEMLSSYPKDLKYEIDFSSVQKLIKEFQYFGHQEKSVPISQSSALVDPRLQRRSSSSPSQDQVHLDKASSFTPPMSPPPIPPPPPPPPPPPVSPHLIPQPSSTLFMSGLKKPCAELTSSEVNIPSSLPVTSPVSPPAIKRQDMLIPGFEPPGSPAFQMLREKVSFLNHSICTSATYLKDRVISTQSVTTWNQIHPTSPLRYTSSSDNTPTRATPVLDRSSCTSTSDERVYQQETKTCKLSNHSSFSKDNSPKTPLTSPVTDDAFSHSSAKIGVGSKKLDTDIPDYNVVITRPLTEAEKKGSQAIKEIRNILLRNRDVLKDTSSEDESTVFDHNTNGNDSLSMEIPRISRVDNSNLNSALKKGDALSRNNSLLIQNGSKKLKESAKNEINVQEYVNKSPLSEDEKHRKNTVMNKTMEDKKTMKNLLLDKTGMVITGDVNTSLTTPSRCLMPPDSSYQSPGTPELKSGLDLLDNLISYERESHKSSPLSASETCRHEDDTRRTNDSIKWSKDHSRSSRETTPRKESFDHLKDHSRSSRETTSRKESFDHLKDHSRSSRETTPRKESFDHLKDHSRSSRETTPRKESFEHLKDHSRSSRETTPRKESFNHLKDYYRSSRETTLRKERSGGERKKESPRRKRKVTIKSTRAMNDHRWDDITSDISDTELPVDCMGSDYHGTQNHKDEDQQRDHRHQRPSPRSKDISRPSSCEGLEPNRYHKYSKDRTPPRYQVSVDPVRKRDIELSELSRQTRRVYRNDQDDLCDDWNREWKRRKLDQQALEMSELLSCDDDSHQSDSAMSISPLDSPVSFEYAVANDGSPHTNYRFVRTSPLEGGSLKVTITRDVGHSETSGTINPDDIHHVDPYHSRDQSMMPSSSTKVDISATSVGPTSAYHSHDRLTIPSSPTEVDITASSIAVNSPGTPETAVPSEDFLHANIGYWSSEYTTKDGLSGQDVDILPPKIDDKRFESTVQQDDIEQTTYGSERESWSTSPSPYRDHDNHDHDIDTEYRHEQQPPIKKSRGEDYTRGRRSNIGKSSGYDCADMSSYTDRTITKSLDYYTSVARDDHLFRSSCHEPYTDEEYDDLRDLNDICPDRYHRYDDQRHREPYYTSRSPYDDIDSPRSFGSSDIEELGHDRLYNTSDKLESYTSFDGRLPFGDVPSKYPTADGCGSPGISDIRSPRYTATDGRGSPFGVRQYPTDGRGSPGIGDIRSPRYTATDGRGSPRIGNNRPLHYSTTNGHGSPCHIDDRISQYSPKRRGITDDEYDEYCYGLSGHDTNIRDSNLCKYREELVNHQNENKNFSSSDEEERNPNICKYTEDFDVYEDEERRSYHSDDEDARDRQVCKYRNDNDEPNCGSDGDAFDGDSLDTPEYYDQENHQSLEVLVENNINLTTLALDRAVFEGIRDFPIQLLQLANYLQNNRKANDIESHSSDSTCVSSSANAALPVNRDPRLSRDSRMQDTSVKREGTTTNNTQENVTLGKIGAHRSVRDFKRKKITADHKKVIKTFPKKQSYFYVYNPDNDPECDSVKHYMLKTGAQYLDISDENNLKTMSGELRVLVRRKHKPSIHRISNLNKLKLRQTVKFALFSTVEDVIKKTRAYAAIFQYGGVLIPDDVILRTVDPVYLEALLGFIAEQNAIHQKVFWVLNIRYIAYKKLGSQRPLTWRDTFVLDLLRKYRNEGFVNIINKDYVMENLSSVQRYLDTALKQQLELMPTYRHFILLSDLNKQILEVSWFLNRGIGFMNVNECLQLFAGEAKMHQLVSASRYTNDGSEYTTFNQIKQECMEYDTIDSPEADDESITTASSSEFLNSSHDVQCDNNHHFTRSLSCNMVSRSASYKKGGDMKEKRLEILSSINDVKANLINNMDDRGPNRKAKEDRAGTQSNVTKQRECRLSKSYEPRLRVHNENVTPRKTDNNRAHHNDDITRTISSKNGVQGSEEAQHPKIPYDKTLSVRGNDRHNKCKGTIQSTYD